MIESRFIIYDNDVMFVYEFIMFDSGFTMFDISFKNNPQDEYIYTLDALRV